VTKTQIGLVVNGSKRTGSAEPRRSLADFLRQDLLLTGTHVGCEQGACGACAVFVDGEPVRSCLMLAVQAAGHEVTTVEGLARGGVWHPIQEAMRDAHAFQCGFCTPGFLMTAVALLEDLDDRPITRLEIREALSGNFCRCSGYQPIVDAVEAAVATMRREVPRGVE
jgi:aerobic-type carbon monoxide dehydrogenase small subunit (CoxS/CutS family)